MPEICIKLLFLIDKDILIGEGKNSSEIKKNIFPKWEKLQNPNGLASQVQNRTEEAKMNLRSTL